jgi:hypothetical protein
VDEAHVEHPVRLVQHQRLHRVQAHAALVDEVEQPARGGDQDVHALGHLALLLALGHAAQHDGRAQAQAAAVGAAGFVDLDREFAGRRQHERARALVRHAGLVGGQALQDRQGEGRRLAGAGLRDAEKVAALQQGRDRLRLHRGGGVVALLAQGAQELRVEAEVGEDRLVGRRRGVVTQRITFFLVNAGARFRKAARTGVHTSATLGEPMAGRATTGP